MTKPVIEMENVSFRYEDQEVLSHINFTINEGDFMGLVGPNGGGKTTLIKLLLGMEKADHGSIRLYGKKIHTFKDKSRLGYVSQKANSFNKGFPATVEEVVSMGLTSKIGYFRRPSLRDKKRVKEAIDKVGMSSFLSKNIGELSGGQQQRIFIARALVSDPDLLILDEPTVGIDSRNVKLFLNVLTALNKQGVTLLLITHDIGVITQYATKIACLNETLHNLGTPGDFQQLSREELSDFYGHPLNLISHKH